MTSKPTPGPWRENGSNTIKALQRARSAIASVEGRS